MKELLKAVLVLGMGGMLVSCGEKESAPAVAEAGGAGEAVRPEGAPSYQHLPGVEAISQRCKKCHAEIYAIWQKSQHGLANRVAGFPQDAGMFAGQTLETKVEKWHFLKDGEQPRIVNNGKEYARGHGHRGVPARAIPGAGGRRALADDQRGLGHRRARSGSTCWAAMTAPRRTGGTGPDAG